MERYQNADLLAMVGAGSPGGRARADGSTLEPGIHLRWQCASELGFPKGGFDLYRRAENLGHYWRCGGFREADVVGIAWVPDDEEHARPGVTLEFAGASSIAAGCKAGFTNAASFPGDRRVRVRFGAPVRVVRLLFRSATAPLPVVDGFADSGGTAVRVARERARQQGSELRVSLFADHIDFVELRGTDMVVCELCFILLQEGRDLFWPQVPLNGSTPIYLPITHPDWGSPHPHSPDDQAEAEARLPPRLPPDARSQYAAGFRDELHDILYALVGTTPQPLYRLSHADAKSAARIDWPGIAFLQMLALDPNLARVLGLYWHDTPPSREVFYDYRVVAHYGAMPYPGQRVRFDDLDVGTRLGTRLVHDGMTLVSANPIDVVSTVWDGAPQTGLRIGREIAAGPVSITLPSPASGAGPRSITVRLVADRAVTAAAYLGTKALATRAVAAGEVTLDFEEPDGITQILLLPAGQIDLISLVLRNELGTVGDVVYDVFHVRVSSTWPTSSPRLEPPAVVAAPTGIDRGHLIRNQSRVDLRWDRNEAGGHWLNSGAPIFYWVQRADLAADGVTVVRKAILNRSAPTLVSERRSGAAGQAMYSDRGVPDGKYTYAVRGIDLFGVLGDWGPAEHVDVADRQPPPAPQAVEARYLDPADPWLTDAEKSWTLANGTGVKLRWQWPGLFALQAPDVTEPAGEFRAYFTPGAPNRFDGAVSGVTTGGATSALTTNINWPGAADALAGQPIRVNQNFFTVTGNTAGANCGITVANLTLPALAPAPGPCSLTLSPRHPAWRDYRRAINWQRRFAVAPAIKTAAVSGRVTGVAPLNAAGAVMTRTGATRTVTLTQKLSDPAGVLLPGALLCDGVVYLAYGHTLGRNLAVHIVPVTAAADASSSIEPAVGATCTYYSGRQYELLVAGISLPIAEGEAAAVAQVALSSSDGEPDVGDDPVWSRPARGGMGDRTGNESSLSASATIQAVRRTLPASVANVPGVPPDPIFASPANYYGQARHTLTWEGVSGVAGYAVYRTSGAALFDQDRRLRQTRKGAYATGSVFADDPGFAAWLAAFDAALTEDALVSDVDHHLGAWRAWTARFYPTLSDTQIQTIAGLPGNEGAFRRVTADLVTGTSFTDVFDGRGQGVYVYRVRTVDDAGNLSAWPTSPAFPPVHIFDVTPPAMPVITGVFGGERLAVLTWRSNRESDLLEYRVWRDTDAARLADIRRTVPTATVPPSGEPVTTFVDEQLTGLRDYFYKVAAVDRNGNVSAATPLLTARVADSRPPQPPSWEQSAWVRVDAASGAIYQYEDPAAQAHPAAIALTVLAGDLMAAATFERKGEYERVWQPLATLTAPVNASDPAAEDARRYVFVDATASTRLVQSYRVRLKDQVGKINTRAFSETRVPPPAAS